MYFGKIKDEDFLKTLFLFGVLFLIAYLLKDMVNLFLLTFVLSFIFYSIQNFFFQKMKKLRINRTGITIVLYLVILAILIFVLYRYLPIVFNQLTWIGTQLRDFNLEKYQEKIDPFIYNTIKTTIQSYAEDGGSFLIKTVGSVWTFSFNAFIALILSLFFILEREHLLTFVQKLENSRISFMIKFYREIGASFINSFGKVMQVQILISFINAVLSVICLFFLGFPQVLGLGVMIFMLGLIPVAGVIISFIPLCIIAYNLGGLMEIVYMVGLIIVLHALESYILNPKLMSMKTKLPVFLSFVILIISEHFFGIWGLLFGVPLFMFLMDLAKVKATE